MLSLVQNAHLARLKVMDWVGFGLSVEHKGYQLSRIPTRENTGLRKDTGGVIGILSLTPKLKTLLMWSTRMLMGFECFPLGFQSGLHFAIS